MHINLKFLWRMSSLILLLFLVTFAASQLIISGGPASLRPNGHDTSSGSSEGSAELLMDMSGSCTYDSKDFKVMGDSLERALFFFDLNVNQLVLDAAVGTRVLQAQLKSILRLHPKLPVLMQQYLIYLEKKADTLSTKIIRAIMTNPNISYVDKKHTLPWVTTEGLWDWPVNDIWEQRSILDSYLPPEGLNATKILSQSRETIEESESDQCIFQVFNCFDQETSPLCRKLFFQQEQSLYSLTHQVIYTLFAKKKQCFRAISSDDLRRYQEKLCGKVWLEASAIAQTGFPPNLADLFVEQIAICGMTGYPNFFRRDWLLQLINWQSVRKSGCFLDSRVPSPVSSSLALLVKMYQDNQSQFQDFVKTQLNQNPNKNFKEFQNAQILSSLEHKVTSRQKRSDAFLKQGNHESCSVHFTAVGITALAMHLRYFVDTCFPTY